MEQKGFFISFEGPEGSGKSTHISLLADFLRQKGLTVSVTHEPGGGTELAAKLRELLLNSKGLVSPRAELFLMLAARAEHVQGLIEPELKSGSVILCDRYIDSSLAYQGFGRGLSIDFVRQANAFATDGRVPELTFLMDIEIQEGLKRAANKSALDRIESEKIEFHKRVREGFLALAGTEERYRLVDCARPMMEIQENLRSEVLKKLEKRV
jgi:dTMP kinase